jgi:NifB/MoaA-like Fe-S oxidoreductase
MEYSLQQLIISSAQEKNILPITSVCNLNCIFCSHKYNPPEVEVLNCGHLSLEKIKEAVGFLNPDSKIVIGESITRIIEGEPFVHPQIKEILIFLRESFPETKIQLTTNGSFLNLGNVELLASLGLIELNISLNSACPDLRKKLMGDKRAQNVLQGIYNLTQFSIPYHGSIVAMPMVSGWEDIEETIRFLHQNQAKTVRIFLPGYTRLTPDKLQFDSELWLRLNDYIKKLNRRYRLPIIVEPPVVEDLEVKLVGVIVNSAADRAGLQNGDQILEINQQGVETRVEAFNRLLETAKPELKAKRAGKVINLKLEKLAGEKPGMVLNYDISLKRLDKVKNIIINSSAQKVLLLISKLGEKVVKMGLKKVMFDMSSKIEIKVLAVENRFFGGSIMSAGLLVVEDFVQAIDDYQSEISDVDLVFLPEEAFDKWGYDLIGESDDKIREYLDCPVVLV